MSSESDLPPTARKNVETIALVERQLLEQRSPTDRLGEQIARFFGSLSFITAHVVFIVGWVLVNTGMILPLSPFDPYPFAFLSAVVGIEFFFLTTFVLMNQKHQMRRTEQWANLHLQLSMLTEQEVTKNLQMLHLICQHLGLKEPGQDQEVNDLSQVTSVTALVDEIDKVRELSQVLADAVSKTETSRSERHQYPD